MKKTICIPIGCRSDEGLSKPIDKRLRESGKFLVFTPKLDPENFPFSYEIMNEMIQKHHPDIVFITGDRIEMTAAAAACFNNGLPIAHIYAGIRNNIGTIDDVNRHIITLQSTIQFCESDRSAVLVSRLRSTIGLPTNEIHVVGVTHMDDTVIEPWEIPEKPFDLVAYNPPATHLNDEDQLKIIEEEWARIQDLTKKSQRVLALFPAPDKGNQIIREMLEVMRCKGWIIIPLLPRGQYFYALQQCERFISNSSATIYEAPLLMNDPKKIIKIGLRNSGRDEGLFQSGASDEIVRITEEYLYAHR